MNPNHSRLRTVNWTTEEKNTTYPHTHMSVKTKVICNQTSVILSTGKWTSWTIWCRSWSRTRPTLKCWCSTEPANWWKRRRRRIVYSTACCPGNNWPIIDCSCFIHACRHRVAASICGLCLHVSHPGVTVWVYMNRPCIGQSSRHIGVSPCCRDPAVQSEFFLRVSRLKTFNWMYWYRELGP